MKDTQRIWNYLAIAVIVAGIAIRLYHVDWPPYDAHSWRQTETAALARNYSREGYRLFYPTVDWRGTTAGYVESELSIYAYTVALAYGVFGVQESVARLVTVGVWTLAALLLYLIGRRAFGARIALLALAMFALLSPFSIYFGRTIMGDMTAQMFLLLSIYAALRWQDGGRLRWLALAAAGAALGGLSKLPSLYIGLPLAVLVFQREGRRALLRPRYWLVAGLAVGVVAAWYWHAYQMGQQTGLTFEIIGRSDQKVGNLGLVLDPGYYRTLWFNFTWRLLTTAGLVLAAAGMLLPRRSRFEIAMFAWVLATLAYFLVAAAGVLVQDYYTLGLLPPAALFAGKALDFLLTRVRGWWQPEHGARGRAAAAVLIAAALAALAYTLLAETIPSSAQMFAANDAIVQVHDTGKWVQAVVPAGTRILTIGAGQPEGLYFADRYGMWIYGDGSRVKNRDFDSWVRAGWKYLIVYTPYWGNMDEAWLKRVHAGRRLVGGGEWFLAYDLTQKPVTDPAHAFTPAPVWQERLSLLGYDLVPGRVVNSRLFAILYWRLEQPTARAYTGFVHVLDAGGAMCAQDDHLPLRGVYGQDQWEVGAVFADAYDIDVSNCPPGAALTFSAGLYDPDSGERLALTNLKSEDQTYRFAISAGPP